jgi:hypothetical protein
MIPGKLKYFHLFPWILPFRATSALSRLMRSNFCPFAAHLSCAAFITLLSNESFVSSISPPNSFFASFCSITSFLFLFLSFPRLQPHPPQPLPFPSTSILHLSLNVPCCSFCRVFQSHSPILSFCFLSPTLCPLSPSCLPSCRSVARSALSRRVEELVVGAVPASCAAARVDIRCSQSREMHAFPLSSSSHPNVPMQPLLFFPLLKEKCPRDEVVAEAAAAMHRG